MAFDLNIEPLRDSKNEYLRDALFGEKEIPDFTGYYNLKKFPIGTTKQGKIYCIDISEACRMLILGATRVGKTWILREFMDRLFKSGKYSVFIGSDIKNEFSSSVRPLQKKFRQFLLIGEKATGIPIITLRPTFFKSLRGLSGQLKDDNILCSVSVTDMTQNDFMVLMKAESLTVNQVVTLHIIYKKIMDNGGLQSLEEFDEIIDNIDELDESQKRAMKYKFYMVKQDMFFDNEHLIDVVELIKKGYIIALNLENFEEFGRTGANYPAVFLNIMQNKINSARKNNQIKPLFNIIDEASRFIPNDFDIATKLTYTESVDIDSKYNINYIFATQIYTKIPEQIIKQCKYIFLPYSIDLNTLKLVLRDVGLLEVSSVQANRLIEMKRSMKKHNWICVNRVDRNITVIKPLAPLSFHAETNE